MAPLLRTCYRDCSDRIARPMSMTLAELASRIGAELVGDGAVVIHRVAPIERAAAGDVTFVANPRYAGFLASTRASAVILGREAECPEGVPSLRAADPYYAFRQALVALHGFRVHPRPGDGAALPSVDGAERESGDGPAAIASASAVIHPDARIASGCVVHPYAVIERGAVLGRGCVVYPGAYVGEEAVLGDECVLFPNVVIYDRCRIGHRVTLHANAVIGSDGFGYATHQGRHEKIPQTGVVVIEDDVEIGSGCVIERAAMEETRVGAGTKFADLISIGHGTRIGRGCLLVSLVGISGSVDVGDYVAFGGQAGVAGHLHIGSGAQIAGKAAIITDVPAGMRMAGMPAIELDAAKRNAIAGRDLYGMAKRLKELEREVAKLRAAIADDAEAGAASRPSHRDLDIAPGTTS